MKQWPFLLTEPKFIKVKAYRGDCYANAFKFLLKNPDWILVHGICIGTGGATHGLPMGHAWVEYIDRDIGFTYAYDIFTDQLVPAELLYKFGQVQYMKKYFHNEAMHLANFHGTYGAWDKTIIDQAVHGPDKRKRKKK